MKDSLILAVLLFAIALAALWANRSQLIPNILPVPVPIPASGGPNLTDSFRAGPNQEDAKRDAAKMAAFFQSFAGILDFDAQDETITNDLQIHRARIKMLRYYCKGQAMASKYPGLSDKFKAYLEDRFGDKVRELSRERRASWVSALQTLSASCANAERNL